MRLYIFTAFLLASIQFGATNARAGGEIPHLDLDVTGAEWQARSAELRRRNQGGPLDAILNFGERNLAWIRHMNQFRPEGQKLSFTSAATQTGTPIDRPSRYNEEIVLGNYRDLLAALPQTMRTVLEGGAFTDAPPLPEAEYLDWGRRVDRVYSYANRWLMMQPYLFQLEARRWMDVRGHYYLAREEGLEAKLRGFAQLGAAEKAWLRELLLGICMNARVSFTNCAIEFGRNENAGTLWAFYGNYRDDGQAVWDSNFTLTVRRSDIAWTLSPERATIPFRDPGSEEVREFLRNIEDEWDFADWRLQLSFQNRSGIPYIEFQPNVTPHVNFLGGNQIVMDANQPLTEYDARWTIRHEFGHVIGFKDCYVEFYDADTAAIVNYQLDIENLMCSRRGQLQETHYRELKRLYGN